jgi:hypothetical protein
MTSLDSAALAKNPAQLAQANPDRVFWQRLYPLNPQWRQLYPHLWQLADDCAIAVLQRLKEPSLIGDTDYLLVSETAASNGFRQITGLCYLSEAFASLAELDAYVQSHRAQLLQGYLAAEAPAARPRTQTLG